MRKSMRKKKIFRATVRHNASTAVVASVERLPDGTVKLNGVGPLDGVMPDVRHLLDQRFPNLSALRRALVAAMRGAVGDTLDHVLLSKWAYVAWEEKASQAAQSLKGAEVDPESIPDEMAKPLPSGDLLIWVDLPSGKVELTIPKDHWAWRRHPN